MTRPKLRPSPAGKSVCLAPRPARMTVQDAAGSCMGSKARSSAKEDVGDDHVRPEPGPDTIRPRWSMSHALLATANRARPTTSPQSQPRADADHPIGVSQVRSRGYPVGAAVAQRRNLPGHRHRCNSTDHPAAGSACVTPRRTGFPASTRSARPGVVPGQRLVVVVGSRLRCVGIQSPGGVVQSLRGTPVCQKVA
jgi:hypothetical protein